MQIIQSLKPGLAVLGKKKVECVAQSCADGVNYLWVSKKTTAWDQLWEDDKTLKLSELPVGTSYFYLYQYQKCLQSQFFKSPREELAPKKMSGAKGKNDPPVEQIIESVQQEFDTSLFSTKVGTKGT